MSKLSNLLENVDHFYNTAVNEYRLSKLAAEPPQTWSMPDDPDEDGDGPPTNKAGGQNDLFNQVQEAARAVRDPDAISEALLVANLYRKAVQLNDGFNFVVQKIKAALNAIEVEDPDDEEDPTNLLVESLMAMSVDATKRAKQAGGGMNKGDSDAGAKALKNLQQTMNTDERDRDLSRAGRSTSDLSDYEENAKDVFDMTGGVGMEAAQQGSGRGYFVRNRKDPKDWIKTYENEKQILMEELPHDTDRNIVKKKQQLIELLERLKRATAVEAATSEKIQTTTGWTEKDDGEGGKTQVAVRPEDQAEITRARAELRELKDQRSSLKTSLRKDVLGRQQDKLFDELKGAKDTKGKIVATQKLLLLKNLISQDKNKGAETKARKQLIAYLENGGTTESEVGKVTYQKLLANIKAAEEKKITIEDYHVEQAEIIRDVKSSGDFSAAFYTLNQHVFMNLRSADVKQFFDKWREEMIKQASDQELTVFGKYLQPLIEIKKQNPRLTVTQMKSLPQMRALWQAMKDLLYLFESKAKIVAERKDHTNKQMKDIEEWLHAIQNMATGKFIFELVTLEGENAKVKAPTFKPKLTMEEVGVAKTLMGQITEFSKRQYPNPFSGKERDNTKKFLNNMADAMIRAIMGAGKTVEDPLWTKHLKKIEAPTSAPNPKNLEQIMDEITGEVIWKDKSTGILYEKDINDNFIIRKDSSHKIRMFKLHQIKLGTK
jgi:hypothetical protein